MSEDCMTVNVFAGKNCKNGKLCPVAFYIYGGAFEYHSPNMYPIEILIDNFASKDIVFVTFQYRQGLLTFAILLTFIYPF
jgi:carboxylesterase type B